LAYEKWLMSDAPSIVARLKEEFLAMLDEAASLSGGGAIGSVRTAL
jgi:hypothetical protein